MSALDKQEGGSHYKDCAIQPVQYIEANSIKFLEGCVIKRCTRHDKPTGKGRQDIEKAIHELQLLLELRYGSGRTEVRPDTLEQPPLAFTGCVICGVFTDHGGLPCPKMRIT